MLRLRLGVIAMILSQLVSFLFPMSFAVDADCNYYQQMQDGTTYYVYNNEYPSYYRGGRTCRWISIAPEGYKVEIACQIEMPQSNSCSMDRLLISLTGNPNLENAHTYCGIGNLTLESQYNNISIGLVTDRSTSGGRFLCTLNAKKVVMPPTCECGWKNTRRIVGGNETQVNEFPMMAALVDLNRGDIVCGVTIIAEYYGLTAAHCFNRQTPNTVGMLVGEHNISSGTETNSTRLLLVASFIIHPQYNVSGEDNANDIGIMKTKTRIEYNMRVGPVCLPFRYYYNSFSEQTVTVLGWGTTDFTGPKSEVLLKTDLDVLSPTQCRSAVGGTNEQICTYRAGHDACQSDSGGPLLYTDETNHLFQVGIIASGFGCASYKPGINIRVTSYLTWILSVTHDAEYCDK